MELKTRKTNISIKKWVDHSIDISLMSSSSKEDIQMANKHMERCSALLIIQFSCPVVSASLWYHGLQDTKLPCPSPAPGARSNSHPSSQWCPPTISSSVIPFSSRHQSFPASGSFPKSHFFASGGQSIGASASASVLPIDIRDWFPLGLTGLISLHSKGLSRVFSNTSSSKTSILWCSAVFILLIIREMQIKTTMRYYLTLVRMTIIKKSTNNQSWSRYGEKGTLLLCWWVWNSPFKTNEEKHINNNKKWIFNSIFSVPNINTIIFLTTDSHF